MKTDTPIPFEDFMKLALHDPRRGYYTRRITAVGGRGDFTTAPMMSSAPARAIAAWVASAMRETKCRNLIEIGPGEGKLAAAVVANLPWTLRWRLRLHLVETSTPLRESQKTLLGDKAIWHDHPTTALDACDGEAVIFSNELVDAFPVRRFCYRDHQWREMAVIMGSDGRTSESLLPPAPLPDSSVFSLAPAVLPDGQIVEVHESYRKWQDEWMPSWKRGRRLTIDYGATVEALYRRRPLGTIRAYLMQQRLVGHDIYQNVGRQDITADINFTDLMRWSEAEMKSQRLCRMHEFLSHHSGHQASDAVLTDPQGAGGAFWVLDELRST